MTSPLLRPVLLLHTLQLDDERLGRQVTLLPLFVFWLLKQNIPAKHRIARPGAAILYGLGC